MLLFDVRFYKISPLYTTFPREAASLRGRCRRSRLQRNLQDIIEVPMDNRKYQMIANGYVCVTIDPETIRQRSEMFLKKSIRNTEERESILRNLLKLCRNAKPGEHIIRDEFTVIVEKRKNSNDEDL